MNLSPDKLAAIRSALAAGEKIQAIKLIRDATGLGLAEAKVAMERLEAGGTPSEVFGSSPAASASFGDPMSAVRAALTAGNKIEAVRLYRDAMKCGLAEAKEAVEAIQRGAVSHPASHPVLPSDATNSPVVKSGCASLVLFLAALGTILGRCLFSA